MLGVSAPASDKSDYQLFAVVVSCVVPRGSCIWLNVFAVMCLRTSGSCIWLNLFLGLVLKVRQEMLFLRYEKAPAGMLLLRNSIVEVRNSPCGHASAHKCYF